MLEQRVIERIARDFPEASRALVTEFLGSYAGPESPITGTFFIGPNITRPTLSYAAATRRN